MYGVTPAPIPIEIWAITFFFPGDYLLAAWLKRNGAHLVHNPSVMTRIRIVMKAAIAKISKKLNFLPMPRLRLDRLLDNFVNLSTPL
jgi:hypothetical protein